MDKGILAECCLSCNLHIVGVDLRGSSDTVDSGRMVWAKGSLLQGWSAADARGKSSKSTREQLCRDVLPKLSMRIEWNH